MVNKLTPFYLALLLAVSGCGLTELGPPAPTPTPPVPPTYTPAPVYPSAWTVTFKVFSAEGAQANLSYGFWSDTAGGLPREFAEQVHLPWERTFSSVPAEELTRLHAVDQSANSLITCEIWLNGQRWISESNTGTMVDEANLPGLPYAECAGRLGEGKK